MSWKIFKYFELNENASYKNLWGTAKAAFRSKFVALKLTIKKEERSQIINLSFHQKKPEKER